MRRILYLLLIAVLVAFGLLFGTLNDQPTKVDYFFFATEWPLALSLMGFFLIGLLTGAAFAYLVMWVRTRRRVRALKRAQGRSERATANQEDRVPALTAND